jgi:hypothetical protein
MVDGTEVDNYASPYIAGQTSTNMYQGQVIRRGEKVTVRFFLDSDTYYISPNTTPMCELWFNDRSGEPYHNGILLM